MVWVILAGLLVWCCLVHVWMAKALDDRAAARGALKEHGDARYRDGFGSGVEAAAAMAEAGLEVLPIQRGSVR